MVKKVSHRTRPVGADDHDGARKTQTALGESGEIEEVDVIRTPRGVGVDHHAGDERHDANGDQHVNISDAVFTLDYLFAGGRDPACPDAADANDSGSVEISDAVAILNQLFVGAASGGIAPPYPKKGEDPTVDGLPRCKESR